MGRAYFSDDYPVDSKALRKSLLKHGVMEEMLPALGDDISDLSTYDRENLERALMVFAERNGIKTGLLVNAVRTAVTGQPVGPEFLDVLLVLGQETVVRRLKNIDWLFRQSD